MTPSRLLGLWRERWSKADEGVPDRPYSRGTVYRTLQFLPRAGIWNLPGVGPLALTLTAGLLFFLIQLEFSRNGQISFGIGLIALAIFVRRFKGALCTLILLMIVLVACGQYFYWRLSRTLILMDLTSITASMSLCALEMCFALYVIARAATALWPIAVQEDTEGASGPAMEVDILADLSGLPDDRIDSAMDDYQQMYSGLTAGSLTLIDGRNRAVTRLFAQTHGHVHVADSPDDAALRHLMSAGSAHYILLSDPAQAMDPDTLERTLPWFGSETGLALLYSPGHRLSPIAQLPNGLTRHFAPATDGPALALLSRADWNTAECPVGRSQLDRWIKRKSAAVIGKRVDETSPRRTDSRTQWLRIERAHSLVLFRAKQRLLAFVDMLYFYRAVGMMALVLLPAMGLIANAPLAQPRGEWILPMLVPYLATLAALYGRAQDRRRWGLIRSVKEVYLGFHLSFLTAFTFLRASLLSPSLWWRRSIGEPLNPRWSATLLLDFGLLLLNLGALLAGLKDLRSLLDPSVPSPGAWTYLLMMLAGVNVAVLLARQACLNEARHIRRFLRRARQLPCTLVLPTGHTLACRTLDVPDWQFRIKLPAGAHLDCNEPLLLHIHHDRSSYLLTVHSQRIEGENRLINTDENCAAELSALRQEIHKRDAAWPAWFPRKDADRLLPLWFDAFYVRCVDGLTRFGNLIKPSTLIEAIKRAIGSSLPG